MDESTMTALYVFVLVNLLDIMTTRAALLRGAQEANPIARRLLEKYGFVGLHTLKFAIVSILPMFVYAFFGDVGFALWVWNAVIGAVVVWNSIILARVSDKKRDSGARGGGERDE